MHIYRSINLCIIYIYVCLCLYMDSRSDLGHGRVVLGSRPYVDNPVFGIHCHPLDSVNPGFIWRAPLVNPLDSRTGIHKMGS